MHVRDSGSALIFCTEELTGPANGAYPMGEGSRGPHSLLRFAGNSQPALEQVTSLFQKHLLNYRQPSGSPRARAQRSLQVSNFLLDPFL